MNGHDQYSGPGAMYLATGAPDEWRCPPRPTDARDFHVSLPGFEPTPLVDLPDLANQLGVARVVVKDESQRFGLPAFKVLGASWAVARVASRRTGLHPTVDLATLARACRDNQFTLVTATEGNHGRAVARMARLLGLPAHIVVPASMLAATVAAIEGEQAVVEQVDGDYAAAVTRAVEVAAAGNATTELVQDVAWDGYEQVPDWIVTGYTTMLWEVEEQLAIDGDHADLVVVPVGVGSLGHAVVDHFRREGLATPARVIAVEPDTAACVLASLAAGRATTVATGTTIMAGLNCPTPSSTAWSHLRDGLAGAVAVSDDQAARASADLVALGVSSGPCGGATLAGLRVLLADADPDTTRHRLDLDRDSVVVLLNTEGAT